MRFTIYIKIKYIADNSTKDGWRELEIQTLTTPLAQSGQPTVTGPQSTDASNKLVLKQCLIDLSGVGSYSILKIESVANIN